MTTLTLDDLSSEPTRNDNDDFETADEIILRVEPWTGSLDPTDTHDYFLLTGLEGDNENDQRNAQLIRIGLEKDSGSAVQAVIYESNRLEMAVLHSDGEFDEVEFIVPRDGGYYVEVTTRTVGQSASYSIYLGGETNVDNSELHDKNNVPPGTGITNSVNIADSLEPRGDLVDYWNIRVPSYRALRIEMSFLEGLPYHLEVLDENFTIMYEMGSDDPFIIENDGTESIKVILRIYLLLSNDDRPVSKKTYYVDLLVWSYLTRPEISTEDEWTSVRMNEDTPLSPPLNLSRHFIEPNGDSVEYELLEYPDHLDISFTYTTIDRQLEDDLVYVEVNILPEENWFGTETLTFKCSDRDGNISDSIDVIVESVNDLPYITRIGDADHDGGIFNMYALEDQIKVYNITYLDDDHPLEEVYFSSNETYDFVSIESSDGTITIDALQSDVGNYWFSLDMTDGSDIVSTLINLDVQSVNDPPPVPRIIVVKGNISNILPGEEIELRASSGEDIDGDELTYSWDWGDGLEDEGETASHIYAEGIYGNKTITLTVSDGQLQEQDSIKVYLQRPGDIAMDNLNKVFDDGSRDVVNLQDEWRITDPDEEHKFIVSKVTRPGVDIVSLKSERRGNHLYVSLRVKESIQIDGSFHYFMYILEPGYSEPFTDFKNITGWDNITSRLPSAEPLISRKYVGDPAIHNESTGTITDQHTLVWVIPLMELAGAGLELPLDGDSFTLFAVTEHVVTYSESKGIAQRYVMTDTAGSGALVIGDINTINSTGGGGSSPFADLDRPTTIGVVIGLIVAFILVISVGVVLMRRQMEQKKKEEEEFREYVEKMNEDGQGLFEREKKEEKLDSKDLYSGSQLESFMKGPDPQPEQAKDLSKEHSVKWDEDEE